MSDGKDKRKYPVFGSNAYHKSPEYKEARMKWQKRIMDEYEADSEKEEEIPKKPPEEAEDDEIEEDLKKWMEGDNDET